MNGDLINGIFEAGGAVMAWRNAYQLWKDREIRGVYWPIYFFYSAWGVWNLWYYRSLDQLISWYAGMVLVIGNLLWIWQATRIYLEGRKEKRS